MARRMRWLSPPERAQEAQAGADLLQNALGDHHLGVRKGEAVHEGQGVHHGAGGEVVDAAAPHGDRQGLPLQPPALAGGAGALAHALLHLPAAGVGLGLPVAALDVVAHALEALVEHPLAPGLVVVQLQLLSAGAVEDDPADLLRQLPPGGGELEVVLLGQGVEVHPGDAVPPDVVPAAGLDGPLQDGQLPVGDDAVRVRLQLAAQAGAGGAGAVGVVEGEHPGGQLLDADAAVLTGVVLAEEDIPLLLEHVGDDQATGEGGGGLHAVGEPLAHIGPDHQAVHHHLDVVLLVLLQLDLLRQLVEGAIHPHPDIAGLPGVLEDLLVLALPGPDHRGQDLDTAALRQGQDLVDDLVDGLLADLLAADGAVGGAHPGPQQAEVVVDLRHRAHGGAGVLAGGLLVDRDGGGQAVDVVHIGLLHLAQEHPGVGAEALHIPPLALGIDGVEGQAGFSGAGQAGDDHQLVPGDLHIHIFQIVFSGTFDVDLVLHGWSPRFSSPLRGEGDFLFFLGGRLRRAGERTGSLLP